MRDEVVEFVRRGGWSCIRKYGMRRVVAVYFVLMAMLSGCAAVGGTTLPLGEALYDHPSGIFSIPIPEGWTVEAGESEQIAWLRSPAGEGDVTVVMIAEALPGETEEEMLQAAQDLLEEYMRDFLPYEDYEIYNDAETLVARNPALILDIARPLGEDYHVGRMVLVYLPAHLVFLTGFGLRADWEAFLPTFREMVDGMTFSVQSLPLAE